MSEKKNIYSISVVIPVYNSEPILPELAERLNDVMPKISDNFEVILVNDGSRDNSWSEILRLSERYEWIKGICLMRNYGQHNALLCGIRQANNEIVVTMDDDLQHPPEEIPKLLEKLNEGFDVVYGSPEKENHGVLRDLASQITKIALKSGMGADAARRVSAFRVFRTYLREGFSDYSGSFVSIDVLLTWATSKFIWIFTKHYPRKIGKSNYSLIELITHALNMVTGFSTLPLQIASIVGFVFTIVGILILFYVIGRYLVQGSPVPGFPFLAAMIAVFSGAQMFSIGIIGEYIARIHSQSMKRPSYQIKQKRVKEN
jgi:undecaprenyl-phosphate 4-deoxy-4-formamido-L-arabinose transferase